MGFDWFTLLAQVLNFLVLVWLLKHFFYDRIVSAMNEREARIARRLDEAAEEKALAEQQAELYREGNRELENAREQLLEKAAQEAEAHRRDLMEAARLDAEKAQEHWLQSLEREREGLLEDFRERLGQRLFALTRQGMRELADADLEEQILKVFTERMQALGAEEREAFLREIRAIGQEIEIRTAFPVSPEGRERLTRFLRQELHDGVVTRFGVAAELICGIELRSGSHRFVWNLDAYLEGLEASVFEILERSAAKHAQPG